MPDTSFYLETKVYNFILRDGSFIKPSPAIGLASNYSPTGFFNEIIGGGYHRYPDVGGAEIWTNWEVMGVEGSGTNIVPFYFGKATDDWGIVAAATIYDELDNVLFHGPLDSPRIVYAGDEFELSAGSLHITIG